MAGDENNNGMDIPTETLAQTESYVAWVSQEPDGETVYHMELGQVTIHFFKEEWDELLELIEDVLANSKKKK
jgi:hypothetical protein